MITGLIILLVVLYAASLVSAYALGRGLGGKEANDRWIVASLYETERRVDGRDYLVMRVTDHEHVEEEIDPREPIVDLGLDERREHACDLASAETKERPYWRGANVRT